MKIFNLKTLLIPFLIVLLTGCPNPPPYIIDDNEGISWNDLNSGQVDDFDENDILNEDEFKYEVTITLGNTPVIDNPRDGNGVSVTTQGGDVVITSTIREVGYVLKGTATNGSVKIYSDYKFKLTLDGADITSNNGPALNIQSGKRVFVVLKGDNKLKDSNTYPSSTAEDMKGCFFSEGQLIFSGNGNLSVAGKYTHAITSDDYIRIIEGNISVTEAVTDAIHVNDKFVMDGGSLNATASGDGIDCKEGFIFINDGNLTINAQGDGIKTSYEDDVNNVIFDYFVVINGGKINITTGSEGIESNQYLVINGGLIEIEAVDNGINAMDQISVNGGAVYSNSRQEDGIDSNGKLTITDGVIIVTGSNSNGKSGLDCKNNAFQITGGTIIGIGEDTSIPTAAISEQHAVILPGGSAGEITCITLGNSSVITYQANKAYTNMLISTPDIDDNKTYDVYRGGSISGVEDENEFHGMYVQTNYDSEGANKTSFTTTSSKVTDTTK